MYIQCICINSINSVYIVTLDINLLLLLFLLTSVLFLYLNLYLCYLLVEFLLTGSLIGDVLCITNEEVILPNTRFSLILLIKNASILPLQGLPVILYGSYQYTKDILQTLYFCSDSFPDGFFIVYIPINEILNNCLLLIMLILELVLTNTGVRQTSLHSLLHTCYLLHMSLYTIKFTHQFITTY